MKKLLTIISIIILILAIFVGCSEKSIQDETTSSINDDNSGSDNIEDYQINSYDLTMEIPTFDIKTSQVESDYILNNVEIPDDLEKLSESEIKVIAEKQEDLFEDLSEAFNNAGINVNVNRETGEIAMDSTVLFGGDSADLTDEGKDFLNKFVKAYTSIIYNEKYDGFISKTMVEGHIAPVSGTTYEGGMPLSEKRAENVKNYCLSKETGVDTSKLASTMETVGYSQSKPIYDADGNVDIPASRRVSFKFIINIDKR